MTFAGRRVGLGTKFSDDHLDELWEIIDVCAPTGRSEAIVKNLRSDQQVKRMSLHEIMFSSRFRLLSDGLERDPEVLADTVLLRWEAAPESVRRVARVKAAHLRELQTGYQSGIASAALPQEPRAKYRPELPKTQRIAAKATELSVGKRTLYRWMKLYDEHGEAGLISERDIAPGLGSRQDQRWWDTAREVKAEHVEKSKPTKSMVIAHTNARALARHGADGIRIPAYATADRILNVLENTEPLFKGSTKHVRDVAGRPEDMHRGLLPSRPGEFMLMDTTRLDVYAMDPVTLRWVGLDLTVAMDWYSRCIVGLLLSPTTRAVDAAAVLFEAFHPKAAEPGWPRQALWPAHGVPRHLWVESEHLDPKSVLTATPTIVPDTVIVDHGKIYVGEHLRGVCRQMGISLAPARLAEPRDKGPVERFFETVRTGFLQELPGYKGADVFSRGLKPESDAHFFIYELENYLREWVTTVYHHEPHKGVGEPALWSKEFSPAQMFDRGVASAGYLEAPRDPALAYQFLPVDWRTIQPSGMQTGNRMYSGPVLEGYRAGEKSPYKHKNGRWPIAVNCDDVRTVYFFDLKYTRQWQPLTWRLAEALTMPMAEDGLKFARDMVFAERGHVDEELTLQATLKRQQLGQADTPQERREALRCSRAQSSLAADLQKADDARKLLADSRATSFIGPLNPAAEAFTDGLDEVEEIFDDDAFDDRIDYDYRPLGKL